MGSEKLVVDGGVKKGSVETEVLDGVLLSKSLLGEVKGALSEVSGVSLYNFVGPCCEVFWGDGRVIVVTSEANKPEEYNGFIVNLHEELLKTGQRIPFRSGTWFFFLFIFIALVLITSLGLLCYFNPGIFGEGYRSSRWMYLGMVTGILLPFLSYSYYPFRYDPAKIPNHLLARV